MAIVPRSELVGGSCVRRRFNVGHMKQEERALVSAEGSDRNAAASSDGRWRRRHVLPLEISQAEGKRQKETVVCGGVGLVLTGIEACA